LNQRVKVISGNWARAALVGRSGRVVRLHRLNGMAWIEFDEPVPAELRPNRIAESDPRSRQACFFPFECAPVEEVKT
jgi:hypothetical protein